MKAFHDDPAVKQKYLDRVIAHRAADNLVKGKGWEDGKGCAIGCTLESYSHSRYPIELGIPEMLAHLEDCIFEGLPNGDSQQWPERFLSAIELGADLSLVGWKFLHWLLTESLIGAYDHKLVRDAVQQCAAVLEPLTRGKKVNQSAASAAWNAAESAESAVSAAWNAARSAESAVSAAWNAAASAESAASAAVRSAAVSAVSAESAASAVSAESAASAVSAVSAASAASAARSAAVRSAAESAVRSAAVRGAAASAAVRSAAASAESAAWQKMADKLIELLKEAK